MIWSKAMLVAIGAAAASTATPAIARPGTPNAEVAWSPGPGQLALRWKNTASEGNVVFDIEGQNDPSIANYAPRGGVGLGTIVTYNFARLAAGRHCFRIWSRVGVQGERSDLPSAFACASVAGIGMPPHGAPNPQPGPPPCAGLVCSAGSLTGLKRK